jgi:hypothetical protein
MRDELNIETEKPSVSQQNCGFYFILLGREVTMEQ